MIIRAFMITVIINHLKKEIAQLKTVLREYALGTRSEEEMKE